MVLEVSAWPERITRTDRSVIFVLDYVILTTESNLTLTILVPEHGYFDAAASTFGWQCGNEVVNRYCQFPLYEATHPNSLNGRLFFAVDLNWPLPATVTQIEWTATVLVNGEPSNQSEHLVLPVLPADSASVSNGLTLDLSTTTIELVAGLDHELLYTFTYTNSGQTALTGVEFHLVVPAETAVQPPTGASFDWLCTVETDGQQACKLAMDEIQPGVTEKERLVLSLAPAVYQKTMRAIVLVVYAIQESLVLNSHSLVVPMQKSPENELRMIKLFLPLLTKAAD